MSFSIPKYPMPSWMDIAYRYRGLKEVPGPNNNPTIIGWAKRLGSKILGIAYNADSVPWCGLFVAHCLDLANIAPVKIAVRAKAWAAWGIPVSPCWGCVLVFERAGGGHVGFYHGEDSTHYHVLGGNQSDSVNIMRLEKSRMIASRWPTGYKQNTGPHVVSASGAPVSVNES